MSYKWPLVKLDNIKAHTKYSCVGGPFGSSLSRKHYTEEGVPVLRGVNLGSDQFFDSDFVYVSKEKAAELHRNMAYPNDVVFTQRGTLGQVAIIPQNARYSSYVVSQSQMKLTVNSEIAHPYYIYSFFRTDKAKQQIETHAIVGGVPHINLGILKALEIPLPPLNIQKKIVNIIRSIDQKITLNTQTNQTLEEMAQAIFKSWFVDFDPVKAKMNGEQPEGMDAATASLFPEKLVESELGLIPEGWDVGTLSDVAKYCSARTKTDSITLENYISTENMLAEKKGVTAASKLPTAKTVAAYKSGDILVSNIRPYFKKIWLAEGSGGRSNDVLGFESVSANTESYLMNVLYQDTFFEYMTRTSKGAKMPRGDKTAIMNWEMAVPPVELREAFSAIVDKFYQLIPQNRAQNATLESLRDMLLPKLLSGELSLTDSLEVTNV
ncbi:TPA: restriction endonuclease subunit S [Vibrio parahaemolyticus]|uniref:restriction endonuclease subunit S n=1 Tax=Vibrio parahaemolyticus TaxID=670 RepID=UPI00248CE210|nr:restriction endonuclease subunit S [Vibrio parahaemolyticus]